MFLSVRLKHLAKEAMRHTVVDKNTGKEIPRVIWADEKTGRYRQVQTDEDGNILRNKNETEVLSRICKGNIELRRVRE